MTKLPNLEVALASLRQALPHIRTAVCAAVMAEALAAVERLINLEHDAHLREIRRGGT